MPHRSLVTSWAAILVAGLAAACADAGPGGELTSFVAVTPVAIIQNPLADAHTGVAYSGALQASGGQPPYTWLRIAGALPNGMNLSGIGALVGAPTVAGLFGFTAKVTDGIGQTSTATFSLRSVPLVPLLISTTTLSPASLGSHYAYNFQATGGAPPFNWVKRSGSLPTGITLSSSGLLSGTPTTPGTFSFIVEVQGNFSQNASRTFTLVVNGGPLTIVTRVVQAARGVPLSLVLHASGGTQPWRWDFPAAVPSWLTLSSSGDLAVSAPVSGTFVFNVRLRDATNAATIASLTIVVARRVALTSTAAPNGTVTAPYSFAFGATEGPTPYVFTRAGGALPPGLTLSGAGVLSGTPTLAGNFAFDVKVRAADGTSDTKSFAINIAQAPLILFSSLPAIHVGVLYNVTLSAQRGQLPYTWTLLSGPPGLSLVTNSLGTRLTGTVLTAGTYTLILRVTDASGAFAQKSFTVTVN